MNRASQQTVKHQLLMENTKDLNPIHMTGKHKENMQLGTMATLGCRRYPDLTSLNKIDLFP